MHQPPRYTRLNDEQLQGARVIRLLDREETRYPLLTRLCLDFGLQILQLHPRVFSLLSRQWVPGPVEYILACKAPDNVHWYRMTPTYPSLSELTAYVKHHEVDILHDYLFGDIGLPGDTGEDTPDAGA